MGFNRNYMLTALGGKSAAPPARGGGMTAAPKLIKQDPFDISGGGTGSFSTFGDGGTVNDPWHLGGDLSERHPNKQGGGGFGGAPGFSGGLRRLRNTSILAQLEEIIGRKGKADPAALNLQRADIARGTDSSVAGLEGQGSLVGGSGVLAALKLAAQQGGTETIARADANETARAEKQQREDLLMVQGILERRASRNAQLKAALAQAQSRGSGTDIGGILGMLGPLLKNFGTGNDGTEDTSYGSTIGASNGEPGGIGYNNGTGWEI